MLVMLAVLLSAVFCAAGAEEPVPATPTDLTCIHEHIKTTIYFFDGPAYSPVSSASHRVSGPGVVETTCLDCGAVLYSETVDMAEEIRPHSMRKGVCVLCGYRVRVLTAEDLPEDLPGERTLFAQEDDNAGGLLTLTLTGTDLTALEKANIKTALVRGETSTVAIALKVQEVRAETERTGSDLYMELAEREDGSFFAGLYLVSDPGEKSEPGEEGISLRFYQETRADVRVSLAPVNTDELVEVDSSWDEHGYWRVPYLEEGTYFLLQ